MRKIPSKALDGEMAFWFLMNYLESRYGKESVSTITKVNELTADCSDQTAGNCDSVSVIDLSVQYCIAWIITTRRPEGRGLDVTRYILS